MEAARAYGTTARASLYSEIFFRRQVKFVYPPMSLLFLDGLTRPLLNTLSWVATLFTALLAVGIFRLSLARHWPEASPKGVVDGSALNVIGFGLALTFYPLLKAYTLGQIQTWLTAFFAGLLLAWMVGAVEIAGILLGLMCLIKPTYVLLLLWGMIRGQWRFLGSAIGTIGAGLAWSVWRFGVFDHLDYLRVLSFIAQRGEAYYPNQSFNGALNRLLFNGVNLTWSVHDYPPLNPVVVAGTALATIAFCSAAFIIPSRTRGQAHDLDLCVMTLTATVTAPLAWEHHYGILLLVYAVSLPQVLLKQPLGRWTVPALATSYVLSANYLPFTNRFANTGFNLVQSYLLVGALIMLGLLYVTLVENTESRDFWTAWKNPATCRSLVESRGLRVSCEEEHNRA
jgi:hypothetical protein